VAIRVGVEAFVLMWGPDEQDAFERDGHVLLPAAFDAVTAASMSEAVWRYVEHRTDIRRDDPGSWPRGAIGTSFKKLKRHTAFGAVLDRPATRSALDGIFGAGGWTASRGGAQVLLTFPDATAEDWRVPSKLWHMDAPFHRRVTPPTAVKLFSVVEPLPLRGGATMVLAGTHNLQAAYACGVPVEKRQGDKDRWHRFLHRTDPWLARFADDHGEPERNEVLARPTTVDGRRIELRELGGDPGDVHVTHINLFHSVSPNANDRPRLLVTHLVRPAGSDG
jgi:hypothetical protein